MARKIVVTLLGVALMVVAFASVAGAQESDDEPTATVVVLVDLSGSLNQRDIVDEIKAVGVMSTVPGIDLYVIGFASNGSLPATVVACEPGDDLGQCTQVLTARTNAQGNDTDHAAALEAAAQVLGPAGPAGSAPRVVLLLTDGEFDPSGSGNPTADERAGLSSALIALQSSGTSVWPIGFGNATKMELTELATSAPGSCKEARGLLVSGSGDVPPAVNKIIGFSDCSGTAVGSGLVISADTGLVVVTYGENELSEPSVEVRTDARTRGRFDCVFDDLAGVWTCEIPTETLGAGAWELTPPLSEYPTPYQQEASASQTTTTTGASVSTTTVRERSTTTTIQEVTSSTAPVSTTVAIEAISVEDEGGGFPWAIVAVGLIGLAVGGGAVWLSKRGQSTSS